MTFETKIFTNPEILIERINDYYFIVANPNKKNSLRLFNKSQLNLFQTLSGKSIESVSKQTNLPKNVIAEFMALLKKDNFINCTNDFSLRKPTKSDCLNLWIHTTDECNLRCKYCYITTKKLRTSMPSDVAKKLQLKILQTARDENLKFVKLRFSGGESFLKYREYAGFINETRIKLLQSGCKLQVAFLTNLTLLDKDIISFIKDHDISISVSLDGIGKYHDSNRIFRNGKGTFGIVNENINRLIAEGISPNLMAVVSNQSIDGLLDLTKYAVRKNLNIRYSIIYHAHLNYDIATPIFTECYNYFESAIKNGYRFTRKHRLCDLKFTNFSKRACTSGNDNAAIYTDGSVYFCHQQVGSKTKSGSIDSCENLFDIIKVGDHHYKELNKDCLTCKYRHICSGGCPLSRIDNKSPSCSFYQNFIPEIFKLIGYERLLESKETNQNISS